MHLIALAWDVDRPGWLDPTVHGLARALGAQGVSCEIVTLGAGPTSTRSVDGVDVTWVAEAPPVMPPSSQYDVARVLATATRASGAAERRCQARLPDAILAMGWQTAYTATTLRSSRGLPIVAQLDTIAPGRGAGSLDDDERLVAQIEWWLTYEARRVVTGSHHVRRQLGSAFRLPPGKVDVIPHGVEVPVAPTSGAHAADPDVAVVDVTVPAARTIRRRVRSTKVSVDPDDVGRALVTVVMDDRRADLALRAMAAGGAVIVPEEGPLHALVHEGRSGVRTARDPRQIATVVAELLGDPQRRERLGRRARERVAERHGWEAVASQHLGTVARAVEEEAELVASARTPRPLRPQLLRSPLLGLVGQPDSPPTNGPHSAEGHG